jgi:hypothetical protein
VSEHLSPLQLDEIAAGLMPAPQHATSCAQCATHLEDLRKQSAAFLARPEAKQQLQRLSPAAPPRRSFLRVLAIAVPLAAGLALFLAWPRAPVEDRIKGAPTVMLLDGSGQAVTHANPGQKLTLAVGSAGFSRVRVVAVDTAGKKDELYAGPIAAGAKVPLMQLEVTPGDVTVTAEFEGGTSASVRLAVP